MCIYGAADTAGTTITLPLTRVYIVDPLLTKTSYIYLPCSKFLVAVDPKDICNLPPNALVIPTVNDVVIPSVAPTATLFDIAADPE